MIVFFLPPAREKLAHKNATFHDNGTMTYTAVRTAVFLPEMNTLSLNDTITVPNLAVLVSSSEGPRFHGTHADRTAFSIRRAWRRTCTTRPSSPRWAST